MSETSMSTFKEIIVTKIKKEYPHLIYMNIQDNLTKKIS